MSTFKIICGIIGLAVVSYLFWEYFRNPEEIEEHLAKKAELQKMGMAVNDRIQEVMPPISTFGALPGFDDLKLNANSKLQTGPKLEMFPRYAGAV